MDPPLRLDPPELWLHLMHVVEERGPLLIPRVSQTLPGMRRADVLDALVVLADANLVQLRTARGVLARRGWRFRVRHEPPPEGVDPDLWEAFAEAAPPFQSSL